LISDISGTIAVEAVCGVASIIVIVGSQAQPGLVVLGAVAVAVVTITVAGIIAWLIIRGLVCIDRRLVIRTLLRSIACLHVLIPAVTPAGIVVITAIFTTLFAVILISVSIPVPGISSPPVVSIIRIASIVITPLIIARPQSGHSGLLEWAPVSDNGRTVFTPAVTIPIIITRAPAVEVYAAVNPPVSIQVTISVIIRSVIRVPAMVISV